MWDKGRYMNPAHGTSYTIQYPEAIVMYVQNDYCAMQQRVAGNILDSIPSSNLLPSTTASRLRKCSCGSYDLSSDDEKYLTPENVAEMAPGQSDRAAILLSAARVHLNSLSEAANKGGQINPNLNDYHTDPMEICSTFWIPDITDWWRQHKETQ